MKTYLVDFENVKSKGLTGIDRLTEDDHVIIFYSENSDTISFEMHCLVMKAKASVDYMKVRVGGKNALDFQLSTLLGYLVAKGDNTHLFIISNDKGFDKLHDFWENTFLDGPACTVFRTVNINAAVNLAASGKKRPVYEAGPETETASSAEEISEAAEEQAVEVEIVRPEETDEVSETVEVPKTVIYSMVGSDDLEEHIAPKPAKKTEEKKTEKAEKKKAEKPAEKKETKPKKDQSAKKNAAAKPEKQAERSAAAKKDTDKKPITAKEAEEQMWMILPEELHPIIGADEKTVTDSSEIIAKYLSDPISEDKHRMLAEFMPGVPDEDIDKVRELLVSSDCKLEVHNLLMKNFDNETSTRYYNLIKKSYFFLKQVLPDNPPEIVAKYIKDKDKNKGGRKTNARKLEEAGGILPDTSAPEPIKITPAMKKKLHELLDDTATPDEFSGVISLMNTSGTSQQLYINLMQRFSRARGRELYRVVKDTFAGFLADASSETDKEKKLTRKAHKVDSKPKHSNVKQSDVQIQDGEKRLHELADPLISPEHFNSVYETVLEANTVHRLYLGLIRKLGRGIGTQVYSAIKQEHEAIKSALSKAEQQ